jgi:aryl-alcohol dehydrogenase-like predicted oxidoreductase
VETRKLGRTGLAPTRLGLGLAALGRPGYINLGHAADLDGDYTVAGMERHAHAVLDAAWASGIRYFDAARSYGRAEEFLASWLAARGVAPAEAVVGSKWGYTYTAGWRTDAKVHEVKDHHLATLERQWSESRAILGTHLDLFQIHSATLESGVLDDAAVLARLARLRAEGVAIGLSVSGARQADAIRRAAAIEVEGAPLFDTVQATWNLLEPSAGAALAEAHASGMGVIVKEALANGRLTERNDDPEFAARARDLDELGRSLGCGRDALALAAALARPWADVVLSGAATSQQLASNLSALDVAWTDPAAVLASSLAEPADRYWSTRASLAWN